MFDKKRFLWKYGFPQFKWILLDYHIFFPIEMAITGDYDNPLGKNMIIQWIIQLSYIPLMDFIGLW